MIGWGEVPGKVESQRPSAMMLLVKYRKLWNCWICPQLLFFLLSFSPFFGGFRLLQLPLPTVKLGEGILASILIEVEFSSAVPTTLLWART